MFLVHGNICLNLAPNGARKCFLRTNLDLANIFGVMDFDFHKSHFCIFVDPVLPGFPNSCAEPHPFCCNICAAIGS